MSDSDVSRLVELVRPLVEHPPIPPTPVEQLHRRVRRRRQRWSATAGALVVALAAGTLWLTGTFASSQRSVDTGTVPSTVPVSPTTIAGPPTTVEPFVTDAAPVGQMQLRTPTEGIAVNGLGLYVTNDAGGQWRNIAPPDTYDPVGHMTAITFLDSRHVWTSWALNSHPISNYRSTDGGRTWTAGAKCGADECPFFTALSFVDARHGWALSGSDDQNGTGVLSVTTDGGATWSTVGPTPFNGQLQYLDATHGWARTGPHALGGGGSYTNPGGALFRTDDGGRTWKAVDPLGIGPGSGSFGMHATYGMPQFFGVDGVVPASVRGPTPDAVVDVLVTHDGGSTWRTQTAPPDPGASTYIGEIPFPFSATSPADWTLFVGPNLYSTRDGGATWTTIVPVPTWRNVVGIDFVTPTHGWANVLNQSCVSPPAGGCTVPILVTTDDGGRTWSVLDPK